MKLKNVEIKNYRLLDQCNIRIDNSTTILVGKNNSGKTSFSCVFEAFLKNKNLTFDDFSISCHGKFVDSYEEYMKKKDRPEHLEDFFLDIDNKIPSIEMKLEIEYGQNDNWSNIRPLLTTLDDTNLLSILFSFKLKKLEEFFETLYINMQQYPRSMRKDKKKIIENISQIILDYYGYTIRPIFEGVHTEEIHLKDIQKIIGCYCITAQRSVEDSNSKTNSKLASVFQAEYRKSRRRKNEDPNHELEELNDAVINSNDNIDEKLAIFFKDFTKSFSTFGYPSMEGSDIILKSSVTLTNLFSGIKLFYSDKKHLLPEKYNGLGYSNLVYIISGILCFKSQLEEEKTDLNLIFLEEPEAHMHPQLQNTFILKLNEFFRQNKINAQVIISTHSPHIVSNAKFESMRYFNRTNHSVEIKDLLEFKINIENQLNSAKDFFDKDTIQFLKQYITLVKCDMFFADKIILIEGSCERLLMPLFIKKIDKIMGMEDEYQNIRPLSEQYIAIIEIGGAYMHRFKELLEFLKIKTLIITDIDSCMSQQKLDKDGNLLYEDNNVTPKKLRPSKHVISKQDINKLVTTNQTLIQWMPKKKKIQDLIFKKFDNDCKELINITYQKNIYSDKNNIKCGRSFEEAFIIDNYKYIFDERENLSSVKNTLSSYANAEEIIENSFDIYTYIDRTSKKTDFTFDLMYISQENWSVPTYIKEGLIWLAK